MTETEKLCYLAGLVDGEGTIGIYMTKPGGRKKAYPRLTLIVCNTDRAMIDWIKENFGGHVYCHKQRAGNLKTSQPDEHYKPLWRWTLEWRNAMDLIERLLPYLITKQQRAREVLAEIGAYKWGVAFK